MEINFNGKRALVTGAGQGIGRDLVQRLANYGAKVFALDKNEANLKTLNEEYPSIETICVDISDWKATKAAVENIGPVDLLVNNAGISDSAALGNVTEEMFDRTFAVNVKGALNIMQVVVKGMKEKGTGGSIVNVSSVASIYSSVNGKILIYAASKAALDRISKLVAVELGPLNIRVNCVNPGFVETPLISHIQKSENLKQMCISRVPLGKFGKTSDIVDNIVYLLSDKAAMVHGTCLFADAGVSAR